MIDKINLSSEHKENIIDLDFFIKKRMSSFTNIRLEIYKNKIEKNFNASFPKFLNYFSKKNSCEISDSLSNFLAPWWLQAVLLLMDREELAEDILNNNFSIFHVDSNLSFYEFYNHSNIKEEIGGNKYLNCFIIALILKKKINFEVIESNKNQSILSVKRNKFNIKSYFNYFIIKTFFIINKIQKKSILFVSDISYYRKLQIIKNLILFKNFPILQEEEIISEKKISYNFHEQDIEHFLFSIFSNKILLEIFNKYQKYAPSKFENIVNFESFKGYINYLNTRALFESLRSKKSILKIFSHGGLFEALWTEEEITSKLVAASWTKANNKEVTSKYYVNKSNNRKGILISLFGHTKFVSRFRAGMTHFEFLNEYLDDIKQLLDQIDTLKRNYILRLPPGRKLDINIDDYRSKGFLIDKNTDIRQTLSESKIHIPTYNATLPFYSLLNDIPSIFFWRDNHFPLPKKYNEINSAFKAECILFNNATKLAKYLNNTNDDTIEYNWKKNNSLINKYKFQLF